MIVTLDFETYWDDIYSMGDSKMSMLEYVTDPRFKVQMLGVKLGDDKPFILKPLEIPELLDDLRSVSVTLIAQNAQFDGLILSKHFGYVAQRYVDTKSMSKALWPHQSSSLRALAERLWPDDPTRRKGDELASSKGVLDFSPELFEAIGGYCKQDVRLTYDAFLEMRDRIPRDEMILIDQLTKWCIRPLLELDFDLMTAYMPHLENERRRVVAESGAWRFAAHYNKDTRQRPQFIKEFERALRKQEARPEDSSYWLSAKVLGSNKAFEAFLLNHGITPPTKLNPKGKPTLALAKNDPEFLAMAGANPHLEHIWEGRRAIKSTQALTRARRFVQTAIAFDGHMPVPLNYNQAQTGRLGGAEGLNMQNLPRNADPSHPDGELRPGVLRRALLAPPGHVVVVGDLSNIEARMLAYEADHHVLLDIFRNGGDPYLWMAGDIYRQPLTKKENPRERNVGKATVLGCGYGMGEERFKHYMHSGPMGMPPIHFEDPRMYGRVVHQYRQSNAPIVQLWALGGTFLEMMHGLQPGESYAWKMCRIEHNRILLPSGLYMEYPNLRSTEDGWMYDSKIEGLHTYIYGAKLIENLTQALANCVMKAAMARVAATMPYAQMVLQVHDELVLVAPEDHADRALEDLLGCLTTVPDWAPGLPVAAEGGYAKNYCK